MFPLESVSPVRRDISRITRPAKGQPRRRAKLFLEPLESRLLLNAADLDPVFDLTGKQFTDFQNGTNQVQAIAVQPDSKIVAVGQTGLTSSAFALARYNLNGQLDSTFGSAGKVITAIGPAQNGVAKGVVVQLDGKIVVAGFAGPTTDQDFALARYNPDGSLDASFGTGGTVLTDFGGNDAATSVALQIDGKIVLAGSTDNTSGLHASVFALARYNANGTLDTSFGTGGMVTTKFGDLDAGANAVLIQTDGKILAAGHTSTSTTFFNFALARYNPDGSLDTGFGSSGLVMTHFGMLDDVHALALQLDGKIVAVGAYDTGSKVDLALARYNPNGSLDTGFGTGGQVTTDLGGLNQSIQGAYLESDGKLVVAGVYEPHAPSQFFVARYGTDGTLDSTFGTNGFTLTDFNPNANDGATSIAPLPDGTFVVGGNDGTDFAVARYMGMLAVGTLSLTTPNAVFVNQTYRSLLGRPVDVSGLATWTSWLGQGQTRTQVVQAIEASTEYRRNIVDSLYASLLGRPADAAGEDTFVTALANRATAEQVKAALLGSAEYGQRAGATDAAFLQAVYHDVLGRNIDATGASAWGAALANGMSRGAVAEQILTSGETSADLVQGYYARFLTRRADTAGLNVWMGQLQQGVRDEAILAGFVGSEEFFERL